MKIFTVNQSELTSDCWMIQFQGLEACKDCEFQNTDDCGGIPIINQIALGNYPESGIGVKTKI